jgi:hypothetical protein
MSPRPARCAGALLVGMLLVVATASSASAAPAPAPTDPFCAAYGDSFDISFRIVFAAQFAESAGPGTGDEAEREFALVLSPKLEQLSRTMADNADPPLDRALRRQADAYAKGVDLLEAAGLTRAQLDALATAPIDISSDDLATLLGGVNLQQADIVRAADQLARARDGADISAASTSARRAYQHAGVDCGVLPEPGVACKQLLTRAEASAALGGKARVANEGNTCVATVGAKKPADDDPRIGIDVYRSPRAYDRITAGVEGQDVAGIGDAASTLGTYNTFASIKTCGRSLVVKAGTRTVVVAMCLGTGVDVPVAVLTDLATKEIDRLAGR